MKRDFFSSENSTTVRTILLLDADDKPRELGLEPPRSALGRLWSGLWHHLNLPELSSLRLDHVDIDEDELMADLNYGRG